MIEIQTKWFPIFAAIQVLAALLVPYIIGVCLGHVRRWFPFINELAADDPERCFFTGLFNSVALLLIVNIKALQSVIDRKLRLQRLSTHLDDVSFWCGALASFGLFIMANFPATKKSKLPFYINCGGAVLFYCGSLVYCGILTYFSFKETENNNEYWFLLVIRCLLLFLYLMAFIGYILFWYFGKSNPEKAMIKISALCQWLLIITVVAFFLTYENDFSIWGQATEFSDVGSTRNASSSCLQGLKNLV